MGLSGFITRLTILVTNYHPIISYKVLIPVLTESHDPPSRDAMHLILTVAQSRALIVMLALLLLLPARYEV